MIAGAGFSLLGRLAPWRLVPGVIKPLLLATRPKTLPAAIVPVWAGCVLAWKLTGKFDLLLALCTIGGAVFMDVGNVFSRVSEIELSHLRPAAGFGVRYKSPIGPIRVDLGTATDQSDDRRDDRREPHP